MVDGLIVGMKDIKGRVLQPWPDRGGQDSLGSVSDWLRSWMEHSDWARSWTSLTYPYGQILYSMQNTQYSQIGLVYGKICPVLSLNTIRGMANTKSVLCHLKLAVEWKDAMVAHQQHNRGADIRMLLGHQQNSLLGLKTSNVTIQSYSCSSSIVLIRIQKGLNSDNYCQKFHFIFNQL